MPRGVYDRSKSKEQRAAEKAGSSKKAAKAAGAPKRKYTRKAQLPNAELKAGSGSLEKMVPGEGVAVAFLRDNTFFAMQEVRNNLSTLKIVADKFGDMPSIYTEIEAHVALLGSLREKAFSEPVQEVSEASTPESDPETEEEEQLPVAAAAPYQASVPLPPPIVPVPAPVAH